MEAMSATSLGDVRSVALKACVIGIDEGQFVSLSHRCRFYSSNFTFVQIGELEGLPSELVIEKLLVLCSSLQTRLSFVRRWPI